MRGARSDEAAHAGFKIESANISLFATSCGSILDGFEEPGHAGRAGYLARRILFKRPEELSHNLDGRNQRPQFVAPPATVKH